MNNALTVPLQNSIIKIPAAEAAIEKAQDPQELRLIEAAIKEYADYLSTKIFMDAYREEAQLLRELEIKACRKIGVWLQDNVTHKGGNPKLLADFQGIPDGISRKESSDYQAMAAVPDEKFENWINLHIERDWEITRGGFRSVAKNYVKGIDETDAMTFDTMKSRALYWTRCILTAYPERFSELVRGIIKVRRGS